MPDTAYIVKIVSIVCPDTAAPGELLYVATSVRNIDTHYRHIWCVMHSVVGDDTYVIINQTVHLAPNDSQPYTAQLIMPTIGFELKVWAYWYDYDHSFWDIGDFKNHYTYLSVSNFKGLTITNYNGG